MKIINLIPDLIHHLKEWDTTPDETSFKSAFSSKYPQIFDPLLYDFEQIRGINFYDHVKTLNWKVYRERVLTELNSDLIEKTAGHHIKSVETLLGKQLKGNLVLFGAFTLMDGYARFHEGTHQVYLGLDDEFASVEAKNVLITHELTHVAREGRTETWTDHGLSPKLGHEEMVNVFPTIEHLFSEGFSCLVSEILNPDLPDAHYVYQTIDSYETAMQLSTHIDEVVHSILKNGHYHELYNLNHYARRIPRYAHYIWAWKWLKNIYLSNNHDIQKVRSLNSKNLFQNALQFKLNE